MNYYNYCTTCIFLFISLLSITIPQSSTAQPLIESAKLIASDRVSQDFLGGSGRVDISGRYAIVGVPFKKDDTEENAGKAYIFELDSLTNEWDELDILEAPNRMEQDAFGVSVAISGEYAIVGANADDEDATEQNPLESAGSVYIYKKSITSHWRFVQKITPADRNEFDRFGTGVDIDGINIVVGATSNDYDVQGDNFRSGAGAAFIFSLDDTEKWVEVSKIVASNRGILDAFGFPVAVAADNVFIGAPRKDDQGLDDVGNTYVYRPDTNGVWNETQRIVSNSPSDNAQFGNSLSAYGNYAIIGEHKSDTSATNGDPLEDAGLAHIFKMDTSSTWSIVQSIEATDRSEKDVFGSSVSISEDYAVVGAIRQNTDSNGENSQTNAGAAYVFTKDGMGSWTQVQKVVPSDREANASFGSEVSIDGDLVAIGSQLATGGEVLFAGAMYILEQCNTKGTINATACDSYVSPGGQQLDSSGTYLDVIPNLAGCDSLITINLTILYSSSATIEMHSCDSFAVPGGDTTLYESGIYVDTIANSVNCDSVITWDITISFVDTSVMQSSDTLTANVMNGLYQWYDCTSGSNIVGATDRTYIVPGSGQFAVFVTDSNSCTGMSVCIDVIASGLKELSTFPTHVSIFPNPSSGKFTVDLGRLYPEYEVSVNNLSGRKLAVIKGTSSQKVEVDISGYPSGIYFIEINSDRYTNTIRLLKH